LTKRKFRDGNDETKKNLIRGLIQLSFDFGFREPFQETEAVRMAKILFSEFKDFSIEELQEASIKYATQQLSFKESHYQTFSIAFVSSVLISYRVFRNKALSTLQKEKERIERDRITQDVPQKISATVKIAIHKVYLAFNKAKEKGKRLDIDENYTGTVFCILRENDAVNLSKEETIEYRQRAFEELEKSFKGSESLNVAFDRMSRNKACYQPQEKLFVDRIKERAAKMFVDDFFTERMKEGVVIQDYLIV
jgi:hypothetical protein